MSVLSFCLLGLGKTIIKKWKGGLLWLGCELIGGHNHNLAVFDILFITSTSLYKVNYKVIRLV